MRKMRYIFITLLFVIIATTSSWLRLASQIKTQLSVSSDNISKGTQKNQKTHNNAISQSDLVRLDAPLLQFIREKDLNSFKKKISSEESGDLESNRSQSFGLVVYFFDHDKPDQKRKWDIITILMSVLKQNTKSRPREVVLFGKIVSKFHPENKEQKKELERFFEKYLKQFPGAWIEASVAWVPLPRSTFKLLRKYSESVQSDQKQDFNYFFSKIKDTDAKKKLQVKSRLRIK